MAVSPRFEFALRLGSEATVRVSGLVTLPILTRALGRDGYGVVVGAGTVSGFFAILAVLGMAFHVGRIVGREAQPSARALLRALVAIALASGAVWAGALVLLAPWLDARFLKQPDGAAAIAWCAVTVLLCSLDGILLAWARQRGRYLSLSLLQAGLALVQLAAVVAVVVAGGHPAAVVACAAVGQALRVGLTLVLIRQTPRAVEPEAGDPLPTLRRCLGDGLILTLGALGTWGMAQGGRLLLGDSLGIGAMGAAGTLAALPAMAGNVCGQPMYPELVRAVAARSRRRLAVAIQRFAATFWLLTVPALAVAVPLAGDGIRLVGGHGFDGLGATGIVLLVAGWLEMAVLPLVFTVSARGWANWNCVAALAGAGVNLAAAVVLAREFGPFGVAVALLCGQCTCTAALAYGLRGTAFPWPAIIPRRAWRIIALGAVGSAVAAAIPHRTWIGMAAACAVAGALMVAGMMMMRRRR